jgi:hypothetical protein
MAAGGARAGGDHRWRLRVAGAAISHGDRHRSLFGAGQLEGLNRLAFVFSSSCRGFAAEYVQTWTMQLTGQRIMFTSDGDHRHSSGWTFATIAIRSAV